MTELLKVEGAAVHGAAGKVVESVSLSLRAGRPFTILGETGSGKSLLAQTIMGILPEGLRASGRVEIEGAAFDLAKPAGYRSVWGRRVSLLPQEPWLALDPTMRAAEQVAEGHLFIRGLGRTEALQAAEQDLDRLGLEDAGHKLPGELSGGMAQRVAFAAATAGGARIVIADEPTKGLDAARRDDVIALLMREVAAGGAVLTITHDLALARRLGGDLAIMLNGRVIESGTAQQVLANPAHAYTRRLIAADPEHWERQARGSVPGGEPVISARDLAKTRGARLLFSNLSLEVRRGEILGITGPSGSGKSSFGDVLLGLLRPDRGVVARAPAIAPRRFQKLYQDPPSAFPQRVAIGTALDDLIRLHRLDAGSLRPLLERLRLSSDLLGRLPSEVSGGELQRFALLRALLLDPVFLFADEPTSRLDLITQQETIGLLVELARERDCAVLIVSHDRTMIDKTCDRSIGIGGTAAGMAAAA